MEKDSLLKNYLSDDERFADLMNGFIFHGEQVIKTQDLQELDTQLHIFSRIFPRGKVKSTYRDLLRRVALGTNFIVVGIENQELVHYSMPVRGMVYDAGEYDKQLRGLKKAIRKRAGINGGEWMSGFTRADRLMPVVTIVVYYGEEPWDGAVSLSEMLDLSHMPAELQNMVNDYHINLLEVRRFEQTSQFRTDLQQVLNFIRYSKDKHKLKELMEQDPKYGELDEEAFDVASAYAGAEELIAYKERYCKEGMVNMCQAIREMMEDSRAEGKIEGEIKGEIKTYINLVGDGLYTLEQAADKMGMTLEEFKRKAEEFGLM